MIKEVDVYEYIDNKWEIVRNDEDPVGHGTSVLSIISSNRNGKYAVFKAFNNEIEKKLLLIQDALDYIYRYIDTKILQMSFGIRAYHSEFESKCRSIAGKGTLIIAAFDNNGAMSFPAAFDFTIGVDGNKYCKTKNDFYIYENGIVDIQAKSGYQVLQTSGDNEWSINPGNSFAASYVSLRLLENDKIYISKDQAMRVFKSDYECKKNKEPNISFLKSRWALFPVNKENETLIHDAEMLVGELTAVYDVKYSNRISKEICSFNGKRKYTIQNIDKCCWDEFDTFVIGHVRELCQLLGRNIKKELLEQCLHYHKNVYCYDSEDIEGFSERFKEENLSLFCADCNNVPDVFGKMYQIKTPVLAIMGTSKSQGKFTLQLQLQIKRIMNERGIHMGFLGTEPTSYLFGADKMVSVGYDSKFGSYLPQQQMRIFNTNAHMIDKMEYDFMMYGGQSGCIPVSTINTCYINFSYMPIIYACCPDGVILCINFSDSIEYIRKCIDIIQGYIGKNIFLISLFAFKNEREHIIHSKKERLSENEILVCIENIEREFSIPVIVSGNREYDDKLFDVIIKHFCE